MAGGCPSVPTCSVALVGSARMGLMAALSPLDVSTMDSSISNNTGPSATAERGKDPDQQGFSEGRGREFVNNADQGHGALNAKPDYRVGGIRLTVLRLTWHLPGGDGVEDGAEDVGVHLQRLLPLEQLRQAVHGRQQPLRTVCPPPPASQTGNRTKPLH